MMLSGLRSAVDDVVRVRVGERIGNLDRPVDRPSRIERPPADDRLQRLARHELQDQVHDILILADLVQRRDVRVRERAADARGGRGSARGASVSRAMSGARTLIATVRPSRVSRAR